MACRHIAFCALVVLSWPGPADAAAGEHKVLRVDEGRAYLHLGRRDGVFPGQAVEVIDSEAIDGIDESFHVGWLVLDSCGEVVSVAAVPEALRPHVKAGTVVRVAAGAVDAPAQAPAAAGAEPMAEPPTRQAGPLDGFRHDSPALVPPGVPLTLSVFAPPPLARPVLMYRLAGEHDYAALPFTARPDDYFVAALPAAAVRAPAVEYYIAADVPEQGRLLAYANPQEPHRVAVEGRLNATEELGRYGVRNEVETMGEYIRYDAADYYWWTNGEYLHRIFGNIYSMRFGAGYLNGQAAPVEGAEVRRIGFLYAYSEAEFRPSDAPWAFMPRVIFGVNDDGVGGGFEGRLRIGDELGLNFEGGMTFLSKLGFDSFMALHMAASRAVRLALAAHLENLPLASELGFRTHVDVRYRFADAWSVSLRLGVAARSIDVIGPETGLGLAYGF